MSREKSEDLIEVDDENRTVDNYNMRNDLGAVYGGPSSRAASLLRRRVKNMSQLPKINMVSDRKKETSKEKKNKRFLSTGVRQHRRPKTKMEISDDLRPGSIN